MAKKKQTAGKTANTFKYVGSCELTINRIEVFSCSRSAVPFYHFTNPDNERFVVGGIRLGQLDEMKDVMFEARLANNFLLPLANSMTDSYEWTKAVHQKVADSGEITGRVMLDLFEDENGIGAFQLGASDILYLKGEDGGIKLCLDEVEVQKMNNC